MKLQHTLAAGLLLLSLSLSALAMDLSQAMAALGPAKTSGQLGEQPNGYLGVVSPGGSAEEIAKLINQARQAEYQRLAEENGLQLGDVEALAGQKALEKTPPGQYIQINGKWLRK
ncbi:YdbL family protein [Pseudomonas sp. N040]|uniref:YdbL family protein n=1 Tax=Pseudomonas sp. N040 TaxID=2785325 RepID=UPI0018A2D5A5|nr:YdbL family protein [Pseudomonas sp. N040]MBF7728710.1 YdbL family protein [Pseudomonas sp. N040]MBW7012350.1 YdbL family protein [Pseudomonas sp. N040]